jgi:hypothetical protein
MAERSRGWLKGCAIGCGVLALVPILGLLIVSVRTCVPLRSASRAQARLEALFGPPESFVPPPDGVVPAARIQAFLVVRRSLAEVCQHAEAMQQQMQRVEKLDGADSPSGREVAGTTKGLGEVAAGIAPLIAELFEQRNHALLEAGMGLGEYSYIFALAYREQLLGESIREVLFCADGPVAPEVLAALRAMLSHQLEASTSEERNEGEHRSLEREIRAMEADPQRLPWQDGLPDAIEVSLAPHRALLDAAYCGSTAQMDMDRHSRRAILCALY